MNSYFSNLPYQRRRKFMFNNLNKSERRRKRNNLPYCMSSQPVRYGPGANISVINRIADISGSAVTRYPLQTLLLQDSEFSAKKNYFRYFKILEVRVCFFPAQAQDAGLMYINLTWNSITYSLEDLQKDDSTKVISNYRTRNKIFRWLPIKGVINVNSIAQEVPTNFVDVSQFISTDRVVSLPGWLYISNLSNNGTAANIEIKVIFRGNDFGTLAKNNDKIAEEDLYKIVEEKIQKPTKKDDNDNQEEEEKNISEEEEEEEDKKLDKKKIFKKKIKKE